MVIEVLFRIRRPKSEDGHKLLSTVKCNSQAFLTKTDKKCDNRKTS